MKPINKFMEIYQFEVRFIVNIESIGVQTSNASRLPEDTPQPRLSKDFVRRERQTKAFVDTPKGLFGWTDQPGDGSHNLTVCR
jgi:hypothetical protein